MIHASSNTSNDFNITHNNMPFQQYSTSANIYLDLDALIVRGRLFLLYYYCLAMENGHLIGIIL
jgi:hypothetical protein